MDPRHAKYMSEAWPALRADAAKALAVRAVDPLARKRQRALRRAMQRGRLASVAKALRPLARGR